MKKIVSIRRSSSEDIDKSIKRILSELEKYGVAISSNGEASRYLSRYLNTQKNQEMIYFSWNKRWKKSVIHLPPEVKLIRIGDRKIKIDLNKKNKKEGFL